MLFELVQSLVYCFPGSVCEEHIDDLSQFATSSSRIQLLHDAAQIGKKVSDGTARLGLTRSCKSTLLANDKSLVKLIVGRLAADGVPICQGAAATDLGIETAAGKRRCATNPRKRIWKRRCATNPNAADSLPKSSNIPGSSGAVSRRKKKKRRMKKLPKISSSHSSSPKRCGVHVGNGALREEAAYWIECWAGLQAGVLLRNHGLRSMGRGGEEGEATDGSVQALLG